MALGIIHLAAFAALTGGLVRSRDAYGNHTVRGFGWGCVSVAWIASGIVLAVEAIT